MHPQFAANSWYGYQVLKACDLRELSRHVLPRRYVSTMTCLSITTEKVESNFYAAMAHISSKGI
jgi:hypothetical protein